MTTVERSGALRIVLITTGIIFIFGIFTLMRIWPSGFLWSPQQPEYEQMLLGVYTTLGIFLLLASRAPHEHRSLILFAGWSSLVHSGIMGVQAILDVTERGHLIGDVPALAIIGGALLILAPTRVTSSETPRDRPEQRPDAVEVARSWPL